MKVDIDSVLVFLSVFIVVGYYVFFWNIFKYNFFCIFFGIDFFKCKFWFCDIKEVIFCLLSCYVNKIVCIILFMF